MSRIERPHPQLLIAVVGPCAAGKSTLVDALKARGYLAREVAQEHSYVPDMWQRFTQPDILIYLDVSWQVAHQRRPTDIDAEQWRQLKQRLSHAQSHADVYIQTDHLNLEDVIEKTLSFLLGLSFH
ncbi:MAG TPA: hypothetical protein ENN19_09335 [Chloroflexi bacterium]|nr:hypothetical protein [Chloroflexota bacterium]